ncbi:hypothetical protein C6497_07165 [Candidatus Poribacteria bacterium]|nr:MAG: hypothetical protein C6497_07165 [Candidatus Poribacteria bacterium]
MSIRPKQFTRIGEFHLEEAVLDVLLEANHEREIIGAAEVSRRAGIFREPGHSMKGGNDAIAWGILGKLIKENRVIKVDQGFKLTDEEFELRRDDVNKK